MRARAAYLLAFPRLSYFFFRREFSRFVFKHDGDVVLDRVAETAWLAHEFACGFPENERPFAQRAHEYVEQARIHVVNLLSTSSPS